MKVLWEGLCKKNPVFVLMLGLVPAIAAASTAERGWMLGLVTAGVFILATMVDYVLLPPFPENTRPIVKFGVLILLTVLVHSLLLGRKPQLVAQLGIFLPMIVINRLLLQSPAKDQCFGRAVLQAISQSLGFILALVVIGAIREFLGFGSIFGRSLISSPLPPLALVESVPGGMIVVGLLLALTNKLTGRGGEQHD